MSDARGVAVSASAGGVKAWTIAHRAHHVVYRIVGEHWAPRSHELRDLLSRNGVSFAFYPVGSPTGQELLREFPVDRARLPALIRHDGTVLNNPSLAEVADAHGIQARPAADIQDLVILGAGPAGLAAAVYGAWEGLTTTVIEELAIGGQAGTSSLILNYLGFARGVGGGDLAHRAWQQALLFGTQLVFTQKAAGLAARAKAEGPQHWPSERGSRDRRFRTHRCRTAHWMAPRRGGSR